MTTRFLASSSPLSLTELNPQATVEAEFGDVVVEGSIVTMAHHGPRAGQKAPCAYENFPAELAAKIEVVGLSHVDLDTLGGCAALLGLKPEAPAFWEAAEHVDLRGPHRLSEIDPTEETRDALNAFWAWSKSKRVFAPRDSALDVTGVVMEGIEALGKILIDRDAALLEAGRVFAADEAKLEAESFMSARDGLGCAIVMRQSESFCNHLYVHGSDVFDACISHNPKTGAVTLSFADRPIRSTARQLVQRLWGELAGGHDAIAGSPRDKMMTLNDAAALADAVIADASASQGV